MFLLRGSRRFATLACVALVGCNVYDSGLIDSDSAGIPARPPAGTSSKSDSQTLVFALRDLFVEQTAESATRIGLDLDAINTTGDENASCRPRQVEGEVVGQSVVDGEKGIDNSLGATLLPAIGFFLPCLQDNMALTQARGISTIVLIIQDWNGQRNDANVTAMLATAVDGTSEDPSLVGFRGRSDVDLVYLQGSQDNPAPDPAWDEGDFWYLDSLDFERDENEVPDLDRPRVVDREAYIAFGRLVFRLPRETGFKLIAGDGTIPSDGSMVIEANEGVLMGDISEDGRHLERGLYTGRMTLEVLSGMTTRVGICNLNATLVQSLFEYADSPSEPANDGLDVECDAFSLGVTFTGLVGAVGGLAPGSRVVPLPCDNAETVAIDQCCPSQWLAGNSREETCDTEAKQEKAAAFDRLPATVALPVPPPELF